MLGFILILGSFWGSVYEEEWGFFGYCWINCMVVFIFLVEMMLFFCYNLEYFIDYVVDFDKCWYVIKYEVVWYYIDIDYWGEYFFLEVLCNWIEVFFCYGELELVQVGSVDMMIVLVLDIL